MNAKIRDFTTIQNRIEAECKKDDRVVDAAVEITTATGNVLDIKIRIFSIFGNFAFTIKVSELTIETLYDGRIIARGKPDEFQNTADPLVRQFVTGALEGPLRDTGRTIRRK